MSAITLTRPIVVKEAETSTLELATPTARNFVAFGSPFVQKSNDVNDNRARPVFNDKVVGKFIAECTSAGETAIDTLTAPDYLTLRWALLDACLSGIAEQKNPDPAVITLSKPIVTHAGNLNELRVSSPAAKFLIKTGVPFEWRTDENDQAFVVYNDRLCMKFLTEMTGRDELELADITAPDWLIARQKIFLALSTFVGSTGNP